MNPSHARRLEHGNIIELVWSGHETPQQVTETTMRIAALAAPLGHRFDLLVDMRTVVAWSQETKAAIIEHQKQLLGLGLQRASVVVGSAVARMQLNNVKRSSRNDRETQWETYEEALNHLIG